jgi:hypothetical protein
MDSRGFLKVYLIGLENEVTSMRLYLMLCLFGYSLAAVAGPGPFGMEIDKSKFSDINSQYMLSFTHDVDVEKVTYSSYRLDSKNLKLKGLHNSTLYFEKKSGTLKCVVLDIDTRRYAEIEAALNKKYRAIDEKNIPLKDKYAIFEQQGTIIKLDAPVLSNQMRLIYINKNIYNTLRQQKAEASKQEQQDDTSVL